jgi:hypothetical protein
MIKQIIAVTYKWLAWIAIIGMWIFIGTLAYWHLHEYKIIDVKQPAKILNEGKVVKRGEIVSYELDYTKYDPVSARVRRQLENDRSVCLMEGSGVAKMGKNTTIVDVTIPPNIWPGKYYLHTYYEYDVNPIKTVKYDYKTEWFEVLP